MSFFSVHNLAVTVEKFKEGMRMEANLYKKMSMARLVWPST